MNEVSNHIKLLQRARLRTAHARMNGSSLRVALGIMIIGCTTATLTLSAPQPPSLLKITAMSWLSLPVDTSEWTCIKKIPVSDCRVVRGFFGAPVDGSTNSWDYAGNRGEYPTTTSTKYDYNRNDGLHLTLADSIGFDAVVLRGGAQTRPYRDAAYELTEPTNTKPIHTLANVTLEQTGFFPSRITGSKFAFFGATNGTIADVSFYRLSTLGALSTNCITWRAGAEITLPAPANAWEASSLYRGLTNRYPASSRTAYSLSAANGTGTPLHISSNNAVHFITNPFTNDTGLASVALDTLVSSAMLPLRGVFAVQDPLDPQLDVSWVNFTAAANGRIRVQLDIPDQVVPANAQVWVTLRFEADTVLADTDGGAPQLALELIPTAAALPEALSWRKFLMKSLFSALSENQVFTAFQNTQTADEFLATLGTGYARRCAQLFNAVDNCYALAPADPLVTQYREWIYLRHLPSLSAIPAPAPPPAGVPNWAWYPRLAWLQHRSVVQWWLDNRVVPTGELGGKVSDDSDWYQQALDLTYFETNGVAQYLKTNAVLLCEMARTNRYLQGGVNRNTMDSLHAYEEGVNHLALMARWFYGDPVYLEYAMESARNIQRLTVTTNGGTWFRNKDAIGYSAANAAIGVDGYATPLLWHTTLQVADYNRNATAISNVTAWEDNWLRFQVPGSYATEINVNTTAVVASSPSRSLNGYGQAAVFGWLSTLNESGGKYLQSWMNDYSISNITYPATYYVDLVYNLGLLDAHPDWVTWWSALNPSLALYANTNPTVLLNQLLAPTTIYSHDITTLYDSARWPDMCTTAEPFVDRVYPNLLEWPARSMLGGYTRRNEFNPKAAVSWEGFGTNYGALVTSHRPDRLTVYAYNFESVAVTGGLRLWELEHGDYEVMIGPDANQDFMMDGVTSLSTKELAKGDAVPITLPPRQVTMINLRQVAKLDSIFDRADLALSASEVVMTNNLVTGIVHNLGARAVTNVVVTLFDTNNAIITNAMLGPLAAPLDLLPRQKPFALPYPGVSRALRVVVAGDGGALEIFQGNNQVELSTP